jgi:hypothetical protein
LNPIGDDGVLEQENRYCMDCSDVVSVEESSRFIYINICMYINKYIYMCIYSSDVAAVEESSRYIYIYKYTYISYIYIYICICTYNVYI